MRLSLGERYVSFRAWRRDSKKFIYFTIDRFPSKKQEIIIPARVSIQFNTGFKSEDNKPIFCGDIIEVCEDEGYTDYDNKPSKWAKIIKWNYEKGVWGIWDCCLTMDIVDTSKEMYKSEWAEHDEPELTQRVAENVCVIGNIHENPELLGHPVN